MTDPRQILRAARNILLMDWPSPAVPRALLSAGFTVFGFCPNRYSKAELVADCPHDVDHKNAFPPKNDEKGYLVFRQLDGQPLAIDFVYVHRPLEELAGIVANQVLPLGAKALWLESPAPSHKAQEIAREHGLVLVECTDIAQTARMIAGGK